MSLSVVANAPKLAGIAKVAVELRALTITEAWYVFPNHSWVVQMSQSNKDQRFTELLQAHHTQLFGYLYAMVHDLNDTEDLYQQTTMVLWKKFGQYQEGTSFFHWAQAAARYELLNYRRDRKRQRQFSEELCVSLSKDFDELDAAALQFRLESLRDCRDQLGEGDRQLLDACYGTKRSFRATADLLGKSHKSVYKTLERIRHVLMTCIEAKLRKQERGS